MTQRIVHIATIANHLPMYAKMRASMAAAGFTEERCRFTLFNNSQANQFEPYGVLRSLRGNGDEPYIMLCHQDLLFNDQCGLTALEKQLEVLQRIDPAWAVAGTAGADHHANLVLHLDDPQGNWRAPDLPRPVVSLDENLLLLQRSHYTMPTPGLAGFHLYGTDLCLNAGLRGEKSYVIDFPVRHLSGGNIATVDFENGLANFTDAWRKRLIFALVRTPCSELRIAPLGWLQNSLRGGRVKAFLRKHGICQIRRPLAKGSG